MTREDVKGSHANKRRRLGERRILIDSHMHAGHAGALTQVNTAAMADALKAGGFQVAYLHAYCGNGYAYWPTRLATMHPALNGRDLVGEFIREMRRAGIVPALYMAPWVHHEKVAEHPEWARARPDGQAGTAFCPNGPFGDHMARLIEELARTYEFARLFLDGVSWSLTAAHGRVPEDLCYCPRCRTTWRQLFGEDIPAKDTPEVRLRFFDFKERVLGAWLDKVRSAIRAAGRKTLMTHNCGTPGMDHDDYTCVENTAHGTPLFGKLAQALAPGKMQEYYPAWQIGASDKPFSRAQLAYTFACSALNNAEGIVTWAAPRPSTNFLTPKFLQRAVDAFDAMQPLWSQTGPHLKPLGEVAIWFSRRNEEALNRETSSLFLSNDTLGAYALCRRLHIPFGFVCDELLDKSRLENVKVLFVGPAAVCRPETAALIRDYIRKGGKAIFTGKSPLLEALDGVKLGEKITNCDYCAKPRFDVRTEVIRLPQGLWPIEEARDCEVWATIVLPSITDPPFLGRPGRETDRPNIVSGRLGRGQWILFAGEIFADYAATCYDVPELALKWALNHLGYRPSIRVMAPGCIDAEFYRIPGGVRVLMAAAVYEQTLPPALAPPRPHAMPFPHVMDIVPIGGISIDTRLPVKSAVNLAGRNLTVRKRGDRVCVRMPPIKQFDAITLRTRM